MNTSRATLTAITIATVFLLMVVILTLRSQISQGVLVIYLLVSLGTFAIYACDKSSAQNRRRRTPESILHILSLLGGWPGALVAQQLFRHKSVKVSFLVVFWLTVLVNCAALVWLVVAGEPEFWSLGP